jgi:chromosome segregation protein
LHFTKLRLSGFKSFVDPTDLVIEPGLTGVVGPNGCGKSNLVEALRWAMGETSAKRMRGGEMDDVIFAGTNARPARNIAEVTLFLDNNAHRAPAPYSDYDEIEVARRIERGFGSGYRVNGREVRARDVQLLFADAASGAQSTAMVSQGRITAVISAKPVERRALLEEAAGIAGLHARRHEAELRLKAAEANLARLDDVIVTMAAQLESLKKQARQAQRYRKISEQVRRFEAIALYRRFETASAERDEAGARLAGAETEVAARLQDALAAGRAREAAADALPALRQAEVAASAELQRLTLALQALDEEERRVQAGLDTARERLQQLAADRAREDELGADAGAAIERLGHERDALIAAQAREREEAAHAASALAAAGEAVAESEAELTRVTRQLAEEDARRAAAHRQIAEARDHRVRLDARQTELARQRETFDAEEAAAPRTAEAEAALAAANARLDANRAGADAASEALRRAEGVLAAARSPLQDAETARAKLVTEIQALTELLAAFGDRRWAPILDAVAVEAGYEAALGAALGDDLIAPADAEAPVHWHGLPAYSYDLALPGNAVPLANFATAPPALARRLAQIGVVRDAAIADQLQPALVPGQRLVTADGGLWRWDGLRRAPGTPSAAAQRLRQRNRLSQLGDELAGIEPKLARLTAEFAAAQQDVITAGRAERAGRETVKSALDALADAQRRDAECRRANAALAARRAALDEAAARLAADLDETSAAETRATAALEALADPSRHHEAIERLRATLAERRGEEARCRGAHDRLQRDAAARAERIATIGAEHGSWQSRAESAARQRQRIEERQTALAAEIERLQRRPDEIAVERGRLAEAVAASSRKRGAAGDALALGEARLKAEEAAGKAADSVLAAAREERVRAESMRDRAEEHLGEVKARIAERLECAPEEILDLVEFRDRDELPGQMEAEARLERLLRERDNMGPVNLVAESEATEVEARYEGLAREREDLTAAIARLRQGIAALNREGRERMLAAFAQVNEHFSRLFAQLFGGGRAHLRLDQPQREPVEGEAANAEPREETVDPLEAGLEIMASPPGKRLQAISLLSGGEQALTVLALIFAVFLTNPAPVCVMDEVDAPLDDANVDRFCRLVADIADETQTRFLIITHHRVTMARMDRLFGVTMAEQGISQLVSVDLQQAEALRKTA